MGIRLGLIVRDRSEDAWRVARLRYPGDPLAERLHRTTRELMDAQWHNEIAAASAQANGDGGVYWLHPFRVTKEFCPYLVGSRAEVGEVLARYLDLGVMAGLLQALPGPV